MGYIKKISVAILFMISIIWLLVAFSEQALFLYSAEEVKGVITAIQAENASCGGRRSKHPCTHYYGDISFTTKTGLGWNYRHFYLDTVRGHDQSITQSKFSVTETVPIMYNSHYPSHIYIKDFMYLNVFSGQLTLPLILLISSLLLLYRKRYKRLKDPRWNKNIELQSIQGSGANFANLDKATQALVNFIHSNYKDVSSNINKPLITNELISLTKSLIKELGLFIQTKNVSYQFDLTIKDIKKINQNIVLNPKNILFFKKITIKDLVDLLTSILDILNSKLNENQIQNSTDMIYVMKQLNMLIDLLVAQFSIFNKTFRV